MDANKLAKLKEIGYTIRDTCESCVWSGFKAGNDWGLCSRPEHDYQHQKHSQKTRILSINKQGHCPTYHYNGRLDETWVELRESG